VLFVAAAFIFMFAAIALHILQTKKLLEQLVYKFIFMLLAGLLFIALAFTKHAVVACEPVTTLTNSSSVVSGNTTTSLTHYTGSVACATTEYELNTGFIAFFTLLGGFLLMLDIIWIIETIMGGNNGL
jgi:regulatory protein YycH of two-component signal transduction system YycFG